MSTTDRMAQGYEPDFDIDSEVGRNGELYVANIADWLREGTGRIEVKTDEKAQHTGRVYVEYGCQKFGRWEKSGIATTPAELWAFVVASDIVIVVPTWRVRDAARRLWKVGEYYRKECVRGSHPTRGVIIPLDRLFFELVNKGAS